MIFAIAYLEKKIIINIKMSANTCLNKLTTTTTTIIIIMIIIIIITTMIIIIMTTTTTKTTCKFNKKICISTKM